MHNIILMAESWKGVNWMMKVRNLSCWTFSETRYSSYIEQPSIPETQYLNIYSVGVEWRWPLIKNYDSWEGNTPGDFPNEADDDIRMTADGWQTMMFIILKAPVRRVALCEANSPPLARSPYSYVVHCKKGEITFELWTEKPSGRACDVTNEAEVWFDLLFFVGTWRKIKWFPETTTFSLFEGIARLHHPNDRKNEGAKWFA